MPNTSHLRSTAVAEEGTVTGAARCLQVTQPVLSRQDIELERRKGVDEPFCHNA
jgi:DNA-binding transcriptional LysR family regulator